MTIQLILFCFLIILLFAFSKKCVTVLHQCLSLISKNKSFHIVIISILFLPGTIIHELSHFVVATILRVPTGKLSVLPSYTTKGEIRAGFLEMGNVDPFRMTLIGIAPMIIGLSLIYAIGEFFLSITHNSQPTTILSSPFLFFVLCYLLFVVSITMFASRKDIEAALITFPITVLLVFIGFKMGIRILLTGELLVTIEKIFTTVNRYLLFSCLINSCILFTLSLVLYLTDSAGRKIHKLK